MTRVIVTRPAHEATAWAQTLAAAGHAVQVLPLIEIGPAPDPDALARCRQALARYDAAMFVSAQAVRAFWAAPGPAPQAVPALRCWAPGPGTARALQAAGVPLAQIDAPLADAAQFDSEALWAVVGRQVGPGHRLLLVHGVSTDGHLGRDWLLAQCEAAGGTAQRCAAYQRCAPQLTPADCERVQAWVGEGAWWLFSSSEAVQHLARACPAVDWSAARALVTHPRIGVAAARLGFGVVRDTRPALPDVLQTLESLH